MSLPIRLSGLVPESIVDGPGLRFAVFTQGCPHHCEGCHNQHTWDMSGGHMSDTDAVFAQIKKVKLLRGVTFTGGEPFAQAAACAEIGLRARRELKYDIVTYTGYLYEELLETAKLDPGVKKLLEATNYLIDGPFVLARRDLLLKFRGSGNQRILDITAYPNSPRAVELTDLK